MGVEKEHTLTKASTTRERQIKRKLKDVIHQIITQILKTIQSVEADDYKSNLHNVILAMANFLGGKFIRNALLFRPPPTHCNSFVQVFCTSLNCYTYRTKYRLSGEGVF